MAHPLFVVICNLHLRFQQLYLLCRQSRYFQDSRFIHTLCQHLSCNLKVSLGYAFLHAFCNSFPLGGINRIFDVAIGHLAGFILTQLLLGKLGYLGFFEKTVKDFVT